MPTMKERLEAAEAERDQLRQERDRLEAAQARTPVGSFGARFVAWFKRLETWEQILFTVIVFAVIALLAFVAEVTVAWLIGKAQHAIAVIAYGIIGAFVGVLIAWGLNRIKLIRERAAPAADDSLWAIEQWKAERSATKRAWSVPDAQTTMAACIRYGMSYLGIVILAAVGMLMAA